MSISIIIININIITYHTIILFAMFYLLFHAQKNKNEECHLHASLANVQPWEETLFRDFLQSWDSLGRSAVGPPCLLS